MNQPVWVLTRRKALGAAFLALVVYVGGIGGSYYLIAHNAASALALCQEANQSRRDQVGLWEFVIHLSPPPPNQTPAQAAQRQVVLSRFQSYLHKVFAPRNCTQQG